VIPTDRPDLLHAATFAWLNDVAFQGIFTTDATLRVRSWNRWLEQHSGVLAEAAVGRLLFDLFPDIALRGFETHFRAALAGESRVLAHAFHKFIIPAKAGAPEPAQTARIAPLLADGAVVGTITAIEDVTERVATERELRHQIEAADFARMMAEDALRTKDEFLATLSHEIRTPLNAVLGWTKILLARDVDQALRRRALEVIDRNAVAQMHMVEDMLDMARIMSGKLRIDVQPVEVIPVVQAALDVVTPTAVAKEISVETVFPAQHQWIAGDADRLQQILWNLLSNAIKFTENGGNISVHVEGTDDGVRITVADTGIGIDPEFLPQMFERFRQAHASSSRRHGGLGLGLPLVRQLVEMHGGSISATSTVGVGSTLTVTLPAMSEAARVNFSQPTVNRILNGIRVLVVEAETDSREMIVVALEQFGAAVVQADSTAAAMQALDETREGGQEIRAIVIDVELAQQDRFQLMEHPSVAPRDDGTEIPVVAITSFRMPAERQRPPAGGFRAHIVKPVTPDALLDALLSVTSSTKRQ
jgi:PAS domain S-box-containing protein